MPAALNSCYGRHKRTVLDHIREAKVSNCLLLYNAAKYTEDYFTLHSPNRIGSIC